MSIGLGVSDMIPRFKPGDFAFDNDNDICEIVEFHSHDSPRCGWARVIYRFNRIGTRIPTEKIVWQMNKNLHKERQL